MIILIPESIANGIAFAGDPQIRIDPEHGTILPVLPLGRLDFADIAGAAALGAELDSSQ